MKKGKASLFGHPYNFNMYSFHRFHRILHNLAANIIPGDPNLVNIVRENPLDGACRAFDRPSFEPHRGLSVMIGGEFGIDDGGLTREFFSLTMRSISESGLFEADGIHEGQTLKMDVKGSWRHFS